MLPGLFMKNVWRYYFVCFWSDPLIESSSDEVINVQGLT